MPLVRFQLRNEYGLGKPELYGEASREDPKAVLDGVAVAGLVGILRQLGDLAEFAAEVFHGLQEQATTTATRSHNLMGRVQRIEAALPPLEKRVLAQTSHIHFAYTAGSDWHARIRNEQHHFIDNDLPRFIMDSYEECRDPPRLHLLDKFDTGGPGSCLRRYSDPTFFRRVSMRVDESNTAKIRRDKKSRKIKKKRSFSKNGEFSRGTSISNRSSRLQFSSPIANGRASPTVSMEDLTFDSGMGDCLNSFDSRSGSGYIECIFSQSDNMQLDERGSNRSLSSRLMQREDSVDSVSRDEVSFRASSITRKKCIKTSSAQMMQHDGPIGSVSHEEESASKSSSTRKKGSRTSSAQLMQHEGSVGSVSHEEESASIPSSLREKGSKATSTHQMQHEDSVGSLSREEESATISSSMMKKVSKASSNQLMQHEDSVGSVSHGEESAAISVCSGSPPRIVSNLSSDTWEQKTEIVEPNEPNICRDKAPESVSSHFSVGRQEEAVTATKIDKLDMQRNASNIAQSISNENQVGDIDSEADHYVDALNTIESESEMDLDFQTKREVEQFLSSTKDTEIRVAAEELTSHKVDQQSSNPGSDDAFDVLSSKEIPVDLREGASEISAEEQSPRVVGTSAGSDCLPGISVRQDYVIDAPKVEAGLHVSSSPRSFPPQDEIKTSSSAKHQESPIKLSGVDFWTNGGLLGLQPAKPPVFAPSDTANVIHNPSVPTSIQKDDDNGDKLHVHEDDEASLSLKKITPVYSSSDPGADIENSCHSNHSSLLGRANGHGMSSTTVVAPGSAVPVAPTPKVADVEPTKDSEGNSSGVFGLGHRLFVDSFRKKLCLVYEEKSELLASDISAVDERQESSHHKVAERICMDQFESLSPVNSFPPSPPLEHMKISFHPVNDLATSKLGLRFSDEGNCREKVTNMFASFQLVPQPAVQLHGPGSDSEDDDDNDTFCQSSPCISEDRLSNHSESNSEKWESNSHDVFYRLSVESASAPTRYGNCVKEAGRLQPDNRVEPPDSFPDCVSEPTLNLPSFDSIRSFPMQEKNDKPELRNVDLPVQPTDQSTPLPPPLPPVEWRSMKPDADAAEVEHEASQALNYATYLNHLALHDQQQSKQTPARPQSTVEEIVQDSMERKDQQKSNVNKDSIPKGGNGGTTDDKEDFLQQIRAKSFNLRRTVTAMPAAPAQAAAANVKVTAILEKANAIRQAVGSDDGEDDSWSDT